MMTINSEEEVEDVGRNVPPRKPYRGGGEREKESEVV
jgi:hypothetical protein